MDNKKNLQKKNWSKFISNRANKNITDNNENTFEKPYKSSLSSGSIASFFGVLAILLSFGVGAYMIINDSQGGVWVSSDRYGGNMGNKTLSGPGFIILGCCLLSFPVYFYIKKRINKNRQTKKKL